MAKTIKVKRGDCLVNICHHENLSWETVWNHPQNSSLKEKRKNPNILKEGDELYIPDREYKHESAQTEKQHVYKVENKTVKFSLTLLDLGKPLANQKWTLKVDGSEVAKGETDENGTFEAQIPASANNGLLLVGDKPDEYKIRFGYVDPIDEVSGVQSRLKNLGFYYGQVDDVNGPLTTAAIAEFQRMVEITGEGKLTDETKQKLVEVHGS
jgi:N-acetylmuramoyl-L-alanine amidase